MKDGNVTVSIVQRRLTDYRVPLFVRLRERLADHGIVLRLYYGDGTPDEVKKGDAGSISWASRLATTYAFGGRVCWQPFGRAVRGSSLVIVTQENKLIANLLPVLGLRSYRLAFWGHGANLQSRAPDGLLERIKRQTTCRVDWWFAYTGQSVRLVTSQGFPKARITNLENAIDTGELRRLVDSVSEADALALRRSLRAGDGKILLFIGSLYDDKRLDFLVHAVAQLSERMPGVVLVIAGDGPLRGQVEAWAAQYSWVRYVGRQTGAKKAALLKIADVVANPGLVGLGILDGFVAGVPMLTTDCGLHSPEVDYLVSGDNGLMTSNDLSAYADALVRVLGSDTERARLAAGASAAGRHYTIENMARNFEQGVLGALA